MKLIDPSVEEFEDDVSDGPRIISGSQPEQVEDGGELFMPPRREQAAPKAGWLSLFGGRRYEPVEDPIPTPQFRNKGAVAGSRPTSSAQPVEEAESEQDDLEIPSFLRRLAN